MLLRYHADERVDVAHRPVDCLEPCRCRGPAYARLRVLLGVVGEELQLLAVAVEYLDEIEATRIVDLIALLETSSRGERLGRLSGDVHEGPLRRKTKSAAQVVVERKAMVAGPIDIYCAKIEDALEARGYTGAVKAIHVTG